MSSRDRIRSFVEKVHRRLTSEFLFRVTQTAICFGLLIGALVLISSRLFVFPYYSYWAIGAGISFFIFIFAWEMLNKPSFSASLLTFDQYFADNILLTSLRAREEESGLLQELRKQTVLRLSPAFTLFKRRKKDLWRTKSLIGIGIAAGMLLILLSFPSETQLEAKDIETEKEILNQIKKEVAETLKKTSPQALKKELQQLEEDLKDTETTEEALRELIKKQKELQLREQKLTEKQQAAEQQGNSTDGLTAAEKEELAALKKVTRDLAEQSGKTQTALSKLGKSTNNPTQTASGQSTSSITNQENGTSQVEPSQIEKELVEQIKKEVATIINKTSPQILKKELKQLEEDLKNTETSEEALGELIKIQKVLQLREQKLSEKQQSAEQQGGTKGGLTAVEKEELAALKKITKDLAEQSGKIKTALSKLEKTSNNHTQTSSGQSTSTNTNQENGTSQGEPSSNQSTSGKNPGEGEGQSEAQGEGLGQGGDKGQDPGQGSSSRDLLSVPSRIGGSSQSTVDSGKIGAGSAEKEQDSAAPMSKGSVKPYKEVIGSYRDSYLQSSDRLRLPPDLQRIVQDYFSSLDTSE